MKLLIPLDEIKKIEDETGTVFIRADDRNYYFCWKFKLDSEYYIND